MSRLLPLVLAGFLAILLTGCQAPEATAPSSVVIPTEAPRVVSPEPGQARRDSGDLYARDCGSSYEDDEVHLCVFDHATSPASPLVVAAGDSKTAQWVPALQVLAEKYHWRLITLTKSGCPFSDIRRNQAKHEYAGCVTWNRAAVERVRALAPDLLITTQFDHYTALRDGKRLQGKKNRDELVRGLSDRITLMQASGIAVVTIAETPRMVFDVADCVGAHLDDLLACSQPRTKALEDAGVVASAALRTGAR